MNTRAGDLLGNYILDSLGQLGHSLRRQAGAAILVCLIFGGGDAFAASFVDYFKIGRMDHCAPLFGEYGNGENEINFSPTKSTGISVLILDSVGSCRVTLPSNPVFFNTITSWPSIASLGGNSIIIPVEAHSPKTISLRSPYNLAPASWNARSSPDAKNRHSMQCGSGRMPISVTTPCNPWMAVYPSSVRTRGAILVSSVMSLSFCPRIIACCASMADCWRLLIPSSKPNSSNVHTASKATPPTTNALASDHFGFSRTIPIATAKLATMAIPNSIAWGQVGSSEPEKNSLTWLHLAAATSWISVVIIAFAKWIWLRRRK